MDVEGDGIMRMGRKGQERRTVMEKGRGKGTDTLQTDNVYTRKEYIEREAAISVIAKISNESDMPVDWHKGMSDAMSAVCRIPAADVRPVVHGRWQPHSKVEVPVYHCSFCGGQALFAWGKQCKSRYCPSCGSRMDKGGDGE